MTISPQFGLLVTAVVAYLAKHQAMASSLCNPDMFMKPFEADKSKYYVCRDDSAQWGMQIGEWELRSCSKGKEFVQSRQKCINKQRVRKQYSVCNRAPSTAGCGAYRPCAAVNVNAQVGRPCNWQSASLTVSASSQQYLQCAPQPQQSCGAWQLRPCSPGCVFQPKLQLCVRAAVQNTCGPTAAPVCGCSAQSACPGSCTCNQGTCCQPIPAPMPAPALSVSVSVCPGNTPAVCPCSQGCPVRTICIRGSCCPQPVIQQSVQVQVSRVTCPTGIISTTPCGGGCPVAQTCFQGCCCPAPPPPPPVYQVAVSVTCPTGVVSNTPCGGGCPVAQSCFQGCCCPGPPPPRPVYQVAVSVTCPTGVVSTTPCGGGCPGAQSCFKGCCCPAPRPAPVFNVGVSVTCPSGVVSSTPCGGGCPMAQSCFQGCCCPAPRPPPPAYQVSVSVTCPTGVVSSTPCGGGCPVAQTCYQGCCCPAPAPRPVSVVVQQRTICPAQQVPVCQCATNNACPTASSCGGAGLCCAAPQPQPVSVGVSVTQTVQRPVCPGSPCQQTVQCGGAVGGCASCQQSTCQCNPGSYSNGVSCVKASTSVAVWSPRTCCNQFGSPCSIRFSKARRSPVSAAKEDAKEGQQPLFYRPRDDANRTCETDCTCTPEEVCVEGVCRRRMVPGEFGCEHDRQCSYDCETSYCHKKYGQCLCKAGFAFINFRTCFKKCPIGTVPTQDGRCKTVETKAAFWNNKKILKVIDSMQSCGPVPVREC